MHNKTVHMVAFLLVIVGGLNWLMVGAFDMNLVAMLLGTGNPARAVYVLVGLAAVYELIGHKGRCSDCKG
jgi:uncharacterized membrane protein YuzA (DUF378 family)